MIQVYNIRPNPALRLNKGSQWNKALKKQIATYHNYRDQVADLGIWLPEDYAHMLFFMPIAKSWTKKKKAERIWCRHLQKPDKDNLEKGLEDAIFRNKDDAHIWNSQATKIWGTCHGIVIADFQVDVFNRQYLERLGRRIEKTPPSRLALT